MPRRKTATRRAVSKKKESKTRSQLVTVSQKKKQKKKKNPARKTAARTPVQIFPPKTLILKIKKSRKRKAARFFKSVTKNVWRELLRPFWYVFRYHFWIMLLSLSLSAAILASAYVIYDTAFKDLPSVNDLTARKQILTTKIFDRNGNVLYQIYKDQNRTLIPLSRVPPDMIHATIAIEDQNFYQHKGVSIRGMARAFWNTVTGKRLEGGSTITQQLVKNTLLTPERTIKRKIREILLAFMVENTYTKDEILDMYFNQVSYGGSTYGVEQAAQVYFGKSAAQLSLAESAFLAGLPEAPSVYSPFGDTPEYAYNRQHDVFNRMVTDGYITPTQAQAAENEKLQFRTNAIDIQAPHFVMYVKSLLEKEYGEDVVSQGGLQVTTTLDLPTQNQAQQIVTSEVNKLAPLRISNGAAMITNPKTGEIVAMIGSKNYFDFANDGQVNVTMRPRQPGSSIKALTYSVAFENGMSPDSTVVDGPVTFSTAGSPPYSPRNYDGKFHGTVTLREALASSYNIPAVKTLASIGIDKVIDKAQQIGITTWGDRKRFGLSLTLGAGEVLMYDMMKLYGTLANGGNTVDLNPILEVRDAQGNVLYHNSCALDHTGCPVAQNVDPKVAYEVSDILADNTARTPAFGPNSVLYIPNQQVSVKTGTTNNLKDNWAIGYTESRVVATWVGNNDGQPMSYVASGITGASPIWNKIMRTQLDDAHPYVLKMPDGLTKVSICVPTNTLPCDGCPKVADEIFISGAEPKQACDPLSFRQHTETPIQVEQTTSDTKILDGVQIGQ